MVSRRSWAVLALLLFLVRVPLAAQEIRRTLPGTRRDTDTMPPRPQSAGATVTGPGVGMIDGLITDSALVPLRGARVSILRTTISVATGPNGRFRITDIPAGQYILIIRRAGYHPTSMVTAINPRDTLRLSYTLSQAPTELAPVIVAEKKKSLKLMEFEYRMKLGQGEFMTQEQIEQHNPSYATELLRTFGTIDVTPTSTGGPEIYYPVSRRATGGMTPTGQAACFMTVYLDNVPLPVPFNLDLLPSPRELAGIEVYAGDATVPVQFSGLSRSSCGVILIWTKDGFSPQSASKKP
jgi:hypothetical protein